MHTTSLPLLATGSLGSAEMLIIIALLIILGLGGTIMAGLIFLIVRTRKKKTVPPPLPIPPKTQSDAP